MFYVFSSSLYKDVVISDESGVGASVSSEALVSTSTEIVPSTSEDLKKADPSAPLFSESSLSIVACQPSSPRAISETCKYFTHSRHRTF